MIHLIFILALASAAICFGLSVFALSAPLEFARWFTPFYWLRRLLGGRSAWPDLAFSYGFGALSLFLLLGIQFGIGGFLVTGALHLWSSPFAVLFF